jgi:hypothetical protein
MFDTPFQTESRNLHDGENVGYIIWVKTPHSPCVEETATSIVSVNERCNSGHNINSHNSENPATQNAISWGVGGGYNLCIN